MHYLREVGGEVGVLGGRQLIPEERVQQYHVPEQAFLEDVHFLSHFEEDAVVL
jgi:hypothetical protein